MSNPIPMPLRAAAGLAALAIDEARRLPNRLVGLPVVAVGAALQVSLKAQQRYAELIIRGDQVLGQLRGQQVGGSPWARFDDEEVMADGPAPSPFDAAAGPEDEDDGRLADVLAAEAARADGLDDGLDLLTLAEVGPDGRVVETVTDGSADGRPGAVEPGSVEEEIGVLAADAGRYDGYLAEPPLPGYDGMSIPQLRARLRGLSERQLADLVDYERATAERPPYLTMLENRLSTVRGR